MQVSNEAQNEYYDEYGSEMEDDDDEPQMPRRILTEAQEDQLIKNLYSEGRRNNEFLKVLEILQKDLELRPLIFEHEQLLSAL